MGCSQLHCTRCCCATVHERHQPRQPCCTARPVALPMGSGTEAGRSIEYLPASDVVVHGGQDAAGGLRVDPPLGRHPLHALLDGVLLLQGDPDVHLQPTPTPSVGTSWEDQARTVVVTVTPANGWGQRQP